MRCVNTVDPVTETLPLPAGSPDSPGPLGRWWSVTARTWLRGWPAVAQLVVDFLLAVPYLLLVCFVLIATILVPVLLIGAPFLAVLLVIAFQLGRLERARLWALTGVRVPAPTVPVREPALWRRHLADRRHWRSVLYLSVAPLWAVLAGSVVITLTCVALACTAVPLYAAALPGGRLALPGNGLVGGFWWLLLVFAVGVLGLLVAPLLAGALVQVSIALARRLLGPAQTEEVRVLSERVQTLTRTREATVDSVEAERRRIERDLHDGPQQRLVAIAMDLGMAQERLARDPAGARELLDKAHSAAKEAVTEMRQVARGIHPPVLTDRGLDAALSALAARAPVPVAVHVDLPARPSPTVEAIAYFCVSEALTNVAKHAHARSAEVAVHDRDGRIEITVSDDGVGGAVLGGADGSGSTGLTGLSDRVRAVDGSLLLQSPAGGPTVLRILLPDTHRTTGSPS